MTTGMGETLPRWRKVLIGALVAAPFLVAPAAAQTLPPPSPSQSQIAAPLDSAGIFSEPAPPGTELVDTVKQLRAAIARAEQAAAKERAAGDHTWNAGGYTGRFSLLRFHVDGTHRLESQADGDRPNLRTHLGVAAESKLLAADMEKSRTYADGLVWKHGFSANVRARYETGMKPMLAAHGPSSLSPGQAFTLETRAEAFQSLDREISDSERLHVGVYGGLHTDLLRADSEIYVEASQEVQHDVPRTVRGFGGVTLSATAREGWKDSIHLGRPWPYAELSGTVSRPVPVSLLGSQDLILSGGIQIQRYPGTPFAARPEVNGILRW